MSAVPDIAEAADPRPWAANLFLAVAWSAAAAPSLAWSARAFGREDQRLQLVLLVLFAAWAVPRVRPKALIDGSPALRIAPIVLATLCAAGLAIGHRTHIDLLAAVSAGLGLFALSGLYLRPATWRAAAVPALLLVALLPFSTSLDVVFGYPARLTIAQLVASALSATGIAAVPTETVLQVDGAAIAVDLPCAGMRSLWAGAVFLLGAALVQRRPVDLRLGAVAIALAAMLFVANTVRVLILAVLSLGLQWPMAAEGVHVPLGIVGFAVSCAAAGALLMRIPAPPVAQDPPGVGLPVLALPMGALWLVAAAIPEAPAPTPTAAVTVDAEPIALTPAEVAYYAHLGVTGVTAWRFDREGLTGRAILVPSADWRAQHLPEQCLGSAGIEVSGSRPARIGDLPVRIAEAGPGTAIWWFQSADTVTDDYAQRVFSGLFGAARPWVMVSVLLDGPTTPDDPRLRVVLGDLRSSVSASLEAP